MGNRKVRVGGWRSWWRLGAAPINVSAFFSVFVLLQALLAAVLLVVFALPVSWREALAFGPLFRAGRWVLDTIVRNLVSNAIKFTRPSGSVRIACKDREDGFVEVSVEDTGVGIDEGRLSQLFHLPRGKSSLGTEGERGTNLGLRICADFVARQGGSIEVTSEVGVGSCFRFTLPASRSSVRSGLQESLS